VHPWLQPAARHDTIYDIDPRQLTARGLRGLILDLDNTLVPWGVREAPDALGVWLQGARAAGLQLCIVSNNGGARVVALVKASFSYRQKLGEITVFRQKLGAPGQVDVDVVVHRIRQRRRRNQGHHTHQALHQHRAVADHPDVALAVDHLGRGARGNQGVEARDRSAHDANEDVRENWPIEVRASSPGEIPAHRRRLELGIGDHDPCDQEQDRADLQEAREVVARAKQQPHRQHGRDEPVGRQYEDGHVPRQQKVRLELRAGDEGPREGGRQHGGRAQQRCLQDLAFSQAVHVPAHEERDRNRAGDGERTPRAARNQPAGVFGQLEAGSRAVGLVGRT